MGTGDRQLLGRGLGEAGAPISLRHADSRLTGQSDRDIITSCLIPGRQRPPSPWGADHANEWAATHAGRSWNWFENGVLC